MLSEVFQAFWRQFCRVPMNLAIAAVRLYQVVLGPILGGHCRFRPSCSVYTIDAIQKYGALRGCYKGLLRIGRCHPWHPGGDDPA